MAIINGKCGEKLTWTLDENGLLTISGTGKMANYDDYAKVAPWDKYREAIKNVIVKSGVTSIGEDAFALCGNLARVMLSNSVTRIGKRAFFGCSNLTNITIPESLRYIGEDVFWSCRGLTTITIPNSVTSIGNNAFGECWELTVHTRV